MNGFQQLVENFFIDWLVMNDKPKIINVERLAVVGYGKILNGESFLAGSEQNQVLFWVTVWVIHAQLPTAKIKIKT